MAYAQNGPTHRHPEQWQSPGRSRHQPILNANSTVGEKISDIFGSNRKHSLPMYKDKPYAYPGSGKKSPWFRQRRAVIIALAITAVLLWWFGLLSALSWFFDSNEPTPKQGGDQSSWSIFSTGSAMDWDSRAEQVRDAFKLSFSGYEKYAWGYDEFHPVAKDHKQMTPSGMGWIIVDALDTMMLMNLTSELAHARQWIHSNLTYDQNHDVNTFETTIRMLGGLLSAHYLSTSFPGVYAPVVDDLSDDMYIEKATDLADRLLGAFNTRSGVPLASVNLHSGQGIPSHADSGASSTAEATSVQIELKYLAKLTGEDHYWHKAETVMKVVDDNQVKDGLVPIFIYADQGTFRGDNIRLGSRGDSYYEYLMKQYLQTSQQEPVYQAMWNESLAGIKKNLITYSHPLNFTVLAERPHGLNNEISPKMDHLVCFMPGTIALATTAGLTLAEARKQPTWGAEQEEDMRLAEELMKTCWGMYTVTPTGLAGEITHFNLHSPPLMYSDFTPNTLPTSPPTLERPSTGSNPDLRPVGADDFIVESNDAHNLQRPETVESLFYMWRITGDLRYREWGWEMFQSFIKHTVVPDGTGYSSISSVMQVPPPLRDNMESFWLAETLKYFYLLFSSSDVLPLTEVVFNTEAHPFPKFELGKLFKTGWKRKKDGEDVAILVNDDRHDQQRQAEQQQPVVLTRTVAETESIAVTSTAIDNIEPSGTMKGAVETSSATKEKPES